MAYTDELCSPYERRKLRTGQKIVMSSNTGYITFQNNTLLSTTHLTLAHEVEIVIVFIFIRALHDSRLDITLAHTMTEWRGPGQGATQGYNMLFLTTFDMNI